MKNYSSLLIGGKLFSSRLMVGTGKYKSAQDMEDSLSNSEAEIITVAVRRIKNDQSGENLLENINWEKYWMLPNTAGCINSDEAVRIAILGRELAKLPFAAIDARARLATSRDADDARPLAATRRQHQGRI